MQMKTGMEIIRQRLSFSFFLFVGTSPLLSHKCCSVHCQPDSHETLGLLVCWSQMHKVAFTNVTH